MSRTVLIVDDSPPMRQALCEVFTREEDFDVCGEANNGQEAIDKARELKPDLVVTDFAMPVMNGLEVTRLLKTLWPELRVIVYTFHSNTFLEQQALTVGASAVVSKSEPITNLVAKARTLFGQIAA